MNLKASGPTFSLFPANDPDCGITLFFIHGFPDNSKVWDYQRRKFEGHYNLLMANLPGVESGTAENADYALARLSEDLLHGLGLLKPEQRKKVVLIAHDMGGPYASEMISRLGESGFLILADTMPLPLFQRALISSSQFWRSSYMLLFQLPIEKLWKKSFFIQVKKIAGRPKNSLDLKLVGLASYRSLRSELIKKVGPGKYLNPCLIIWGSRDQFLLPLKLTQWREIFKKSECAILDCSHWPMFERPDEFNSLIEKFIADHVVRIA